MTCRDLAAMKLSHIQDCDTSQLVDLQTIQIDPALPLRERFSSFMEKIKNPYLFKVGGVSVAVRYAGEKTLFASLVDFLQ